MGVLRPYRYLYKPYRVLWFETEELALMAIGLLTSISITVFMIFPFLFLVYLVRKCKKKYPRGYLKHLAFHLGYYRFKGAPASYEREFQE